MSSDKDMIARIKQQAAERERLRRKQGGEGGADNTAPLSQKAEERIQAPEYIPQPPKTIAETGLNDTFVMNLVMKTIFNRGTIEAMQIADEMHLEFSVIEEALGKIRGAQLAQTEGGSAAFGGVKLRWSLTDKGVERANEVLKRDNYRGPAPVPFSEYVKQLKRQSIKNYTVTPEMVETAFSRLVLNPQVPKRIGPAINSGRSIFLYGPPGNGKTSLAECITDTIGGAIFVPHALIIENEIVRVYDDLYHKVIPQDEFTHDARWVYSKRPVVVVGGELTLNMLDLTWSGAATYYEAPFQVKANSGVLFIDDFGRQHCEPQELLNRWIVPLESGFDFMAFKTGGKAKVPFDSLIVFSTNLDPKELVDEAFLRRIRYKIEVGDPSEEHFKKIFEIMCRVRDIAYDEKIVDYLIEKHYKANNRCFRACQPRDLLDQMVDIQKYTKSMPELTEDVIDQLCELYFVEL
ncbi:ATP-binding protein [Candidatus Sumerlaeota bacterium]|nr:ATP-binding protein [Candidatus Sumerlaeota bacterium]